jgi:hypothetical protein
MGVHELKNMSRVILKTLLDKLALIEARNKYLDGVMQCLWTS